MRKLLYYMPILFMLLVSCSAQKQMIEVPVEVIKTEYIHDTRVDSIFVKDSVDRFVRGDTVFIYKEHMKYRYLNKTDTIVRVDTIPKIVKLETVKEVEVNHIKWYQEALMWIGSIMSLLFIGYLICKFKKNGF